MKFSTVISAADTEAQYEFHLSHSSSKTGRFSTIRKEHVRELVDDSDQNEDQITATMIKGEQKKYAENSEGEEGE